MAVFVRSCGPLSDSGEDGSSPAAQLEDSGVSLGDEAGIKGDLGLTVRVERIVEAGKFVIRPGSVRHTAHNIVILDLGDRDKWERAETGAMPSQCWRYADALRPSGFNPKLAVIDADDSRLLMPFVERTFGDHIDVATLPGLSGASIIPSSAAPLEAWRRFATTQRWVSGYIQLSPASYPNAPDEARAVYQTDVFMMDPSDWTIRVASTIIRRKVAAARRAGATTIEDRVTLAARLTVLYPAMLKRFNVAPILEADTLLAWSMDSQNVLVGISIDGEIEAVHLVHVHGENAEFQIAGLTPRGRSLSALLYVTVIERLKTMGVTCFNLGGGGNQGHGLYMFKTWLGAAPVPLQSIRHIYDYASYQALCRDSGVNPSTGWFPSYRAPHVT
jgi:hypothetical protein